MIQKNLTGKHSLTFNEHYFEWNNLTRDLFASLKALWLKPFTHIQTNLREKNTVLFFMSTILNEEEESIARNIVVY